MNFALAVFGRCSGAEPAQSQFPVVSCGAAGRIRTGVGREDLPAIQSLFADLEAGALDHSATAACKPPMRSGMSDRWGEFKHSLLMLLPGKTAP